MRRMELDKCGRGEIDAPEKDNERLRVNIQQLIWRLPSPELWNRKSSADPGLKHKSNRDSKLRQG